MGRGTGTGAWDWGVSALSSWHLEVLGRTVIVRCRWPKYPFLLAVVTG